MKLSRLKTIAIDFIALVLGFLFLIFSRNKMQDYINLIQEYYPQIESLAQGTPSMFELSSLVEGISPIMNKYFFFLYALPVVLFLLFVVSQGINCQLAFRKKINFRYLLYFSLISIPFLLIIGFLSVNLFFRLSEIYSSILMGQFVFDYISLIYFISVVLIFYLYVIVLSSLHKIEDIKEGILIALKRFYPLFLIFLPFFFVILILISIVFVNFIFVISESYSFISFLISFVFVIVLLFVIDKYRDYFSGLFSSYKGK